MTTKYGIIAIIEESGKKKCDFQNCKFNSVMDFIQFLRDEKLTKTIFNY